MAETKALELAYQKLYLMRATENHLIANYGSNEIKTPLHLGHGAEAICLAVLDAIPGEKSLFGTYRSHNLFLAQTQDLNAFMGEMLGRESGIYGGRAGSMHLSAPEKGLVWTSAIVSTTVPLAVGMALAHQKTKSDKTVISFFGDGALEEGVFWESLNFAKLHQLKILFVCEDNELAIHTSKKERQSFEISKMVASFQVPYFKDEGYEYVGLHKRLQGFWKSVQNGPGFAHIDYLRLMEHVGIREDWDAGYRKRPENLSQLDPLINHRKACIDAGFSEAALKKIESEIDSRISEAYQNALKSKKSEGAHAHLHVYGAP